MPPATSDPLIGRRLRDKWRIDSVLGKGGMGTVYAATHRNGARGAIKILHPHQTTNDAIKARFVREGLVANRVEHNGVVRVLDDDVTEDGLAFVVMELLNGETWKSRWLACGRALPARDVLSTAASVLDILAAAHDAGVVHRDIKPDNVFLTNDGETKLLDFGIARLREASIDQTETGAMLGTPAFMSPEQAMARWSQVDATSDLFSLGATIWVLISGQPLHISETGPEALVAAATRHARPFVSVFPGATPELARAVDRALMFDRSARWSSANDMLEAVNSALESVDAAASTASSAPGQRAAHTEKPASNSAPAEARSSATDVSAAPARVLEASDKSAISAATTPATPPIKPSIVWPMAAGAALAIAAGVAGSLLLREAPPSPPPQTTDTVERRPVQPIDPGPSASTPTTLTSATPESATPVTVAVPTARPKSGCMCRPPDGRAACRAFERIDCNCQGRFVAFPARGASSRVFSFPPSTGLASRQGKPCSGFSSSGTPEDGTFDCHATCATRENYAGVPGSYCRGTDRFGVQVVGKLECPR